MGKPSKTICLPRKQSESRVTFLSHSFNEDTSPSFTLGHCGETSDPVAGGTASQKRHLSNKPLKNTLGNGI